jgi:hypothetical protein
LKKLKNKGDTENEPKIELELEEDEVVENEEKKLQKKTKMKKKRYRRDINQANFPYVIHSNVYVELILVVDMKMYEYYGENLENHVLTTMFLVYLIN